MTNNQFNMELVQAMFQLSSEHNPMSPEYLKGCFKLASENKDYAEAIHDCMVSTVAIAACHHGADCLDLSHHHGRVKMFGMEELPIHLLPIIQLHVGTKSMLEDAGLSIDAFIVEEIH